MLLVLIIAASLLVTVAGLVARRTSGPAAHRWSQWLRLAALGAAAVAAVVLAPAAARDSGRFAAVLLGVPIVLAAVPAGWYLFTGRPRGGIDWLAAVLAIGWAVLLALGIGLAFVPAALLQLAAAATATATDRSLPAPAAPRQN
jgi:hypothetical protein